MKIIKVHQQLVWGGTDVTLEVPEFENFGKRMQELERLADEADPIDTAEVEASTARMMADMEEHQEKARQKMEAMSWGPRKLFHAVMLGVTGKMVRRVKESHAKEDDSNEPEDNVEVEQPKPPNLQRLELSLPKEIKWDAKTQALVEQFFADWPKTRRVVLEATFNYYKKNYDNFLEFFDGHKGLRFILPEPGSPEAIADLFYFRKIFLHRDGAIGLSGGTTWEMEHGFGLRLEEGKVAEIGEEDVAFTGRSD